MKFFILPIFLLLINACTTQPHFKNKEVCFLLFNLDNGSFERIINHTRCEERFPAASTFKVPLAVMAFDKEVLKDEKSQLKWNGEKQFLESWNKDRTAISWMQDSVVWFSQELTPQLGKKTIEKYLKDFEYGNADMSGGVKYAWLTPAPSTEDNRKNTLRISAFEQVHFLKRLWRGELKAGSEAQIKTKNILPNEFGKEGRVLTGKTGSATVGKERELRLGWWVGFLQSKGKHYVVVINFTDKHQVQDAGFAGPEAREVAKKILAEKKLW